MNIHEIFQPPVGADLSRPQPIYRPSADGPVSVLFCEKSLSALVKWSAIQMKKVTNSVTGEKHGYYA